MQINGIGSNNHSDMHHVTNCIHNHKHRLEGKVGGAGGANVTATPSVPTSEQQSQTTFDISAWLQNTLSGVRGLFGKIWGSDTMQQNLQQDLQQLSDAKTLHTSQIEAASAAVQPPQNFNNNPYFAAIQENETPQQNIWQKIKVRFQNIAGFLAKRFSFAGGGAFQTKQERPKEDLRRHSRYRKDEVEIDCIVTDESYLMDSYNKKGEYSKLSTEKH